MVFCVVLSCRSDKDPGRTYHRFPNESSRLKQWLNILGFKKDKLKWASAVCTKHFRTKDYYPGTKRLLPDAVPSIRLKKPKAKDVNQVKNSNHNKLNVSKMEKPDSPKKSVKNLNIPNKNKKTVLNVQSASRPQLLPGKSSDNKELISQQRHPLKADPGLQSKSNGMKKTITSGKVGTSKFGKFPSIQFKKGLKVNLNASLKLDEQNQCMSTNEVLNEKTNKTFEENTNKVSKNYSTVNNAKLSNPEDKISLINQSSNFKITSASCSKSVKRYLDESIYDDHNKKKRFKRQRLQTDSQEKSDSPSNNNKGILGNSIRHRSSDQQKNMREEKSISPSNKNNHKVLNNGTRYRVLDKQKTMRQGQRCSKVNHNITNIEQTILEMQNKILKLEKKSILDEKKIETFKKALIRQRNSDIKILMDEKENELLLRMDLLYLDYDPQRICRLCLLLVDKKECLISLTRPPNNHALSELIKNTTNIQIEFEDGMPSGICKECLQQIKRVDWIRRRSLRSNMLIKKFLSMKKTLNDGGNIASQPASTLLNNINSDKPQFGDDLFEEEISGALKIEDVFSLENSPESTPFDNVYLKQEAESDDEISKISLVHELLPTKTNHKTFVRKVKKCKNCGTIFTNLWSQRNHMKYCRRTFRCSECNKCFWNGQLFFKHKQRTQTCICVESQRCCYDCEIVFRWRWQLVFHVILHSPQLCTLCDKVLHSVAHLKNHFMKTHLI